MRASRGQTFEAASLKRPATDAAEAAPYPDAATFYDQVHAPPGRDQQEAR